MNNKQLAYGAGSFTIIIMSAKEIAIIVGELSDGNRWSAIIRAVLLLLTIALMVIAGWIFAKKAKQATQEREEIKTQFTYCLLCSEVPVYDDHANLCHRCWTIDAERRITVLENLERTP